MTILKQLIKNKNTLRNPHLEKSYLAGLSEVGVPEVHQVSESPTLLIMFYLYFHSLIWHNKGYG